jgi:predicted AlkP superfamily phosphohydrolase/phosphomutase
MAAAAGKSAFEVANRLLPRGVKMRLDERFRGLSQRMIAGSFIADVEWARTQAYCYYWDTDPCINLRGREPQGIVEPSHYAAVRRWIAERLLAARDARTARPVVKRVIPCEEAYRGPCVEGSPDLIVWWDDRGPIERVRVTGADGGEREVRPSTGLWDVVTGGHHPDGTVIMWGRGIRAGCRLDGASIMDIAPTVLHLLGQPAPAHMDGRVIADALTDDYAAPEVGEARLPGAPEQTVGAASRGDSAGDTGVPLGRGDPDRPQDRDSATAPSDHGYTDDERVAVEQRLRNLGYL